MKSEFGGSQQVLPTPPRPPSPIFPQSSQDKIASSSSSAFNINQMLEQITQQSVEQFPAMTATKTPKMEDPMDLLSLAVEGGFLGFIGISGPFSQKLGLEKRPKKI